MRAKDFKTIQSLLKEYGMTPGVSTPVGQQSHGSVAKASSQSKSPSKVKSKSPTMAKNVSPTTAKIARQDKLDQEPFLTTKAGEQEVDSILKDKDGKDIGTVVSKVGDKPNPDAVVIKDPKNKFRIVDPDEEMFIQNPEYVEVEEGKLGTKLSKDRKLFKLGRKIKKLTRSNKLREQGTEQLFEINFNQKSIAQEALTLPIKCGFEAETSWESVYGGSEDEDWLYEYNWYDIEDMIRDQEGSRSVGEIEESYNEWISERAYDMEGDIIEDLVSEREEDEYYLNDYIEQELSEDDIDEYKERILDDLPEEDQDEYADWDFLNWGRQYVEEELLGEYKDWLRDIIRDEGEAMDRAFDEARSEYDMDTWASDEYGGWGNTLSEHGIYLSNPDGEGGGQDEVAEYIRNWAEDNSVTDEVQAGDYHAGYGDTKQGYWRVEGDPSISTSGTGSEIISPVYRTPQAMLTEMKSLFEYLDNNDVETNSSTGLHVTMSWNGEPDAPMDDSGRRQGDEANKVKMAVLLGDKYLLSTFGREGNTYAKSQYDNLKRMGADLKADPNNTKTIKAIEKILVKGISGEKYSAINFKGDSDKDSGNNLIEFRIGGGHDYHQDFNKCAKAVIRYATVMSAGYSDTQFNRDYAKALFSFINKLDKIDDRDVERAKGDIEHPAIDVLKDFYGKEQYVTGVQHLNQAFYNLDLYKKFSDPEADAKWKRDIEKYEKGTGEKVDIEEVEQAEPINAYIRPDRTAPSKRAKEHLTKAQEYFMIALAQAGYDLNQNLNRQPVNAKGIGVLRKTIKEFELNYKDIDTKLSSIERKIEYGGRTYPDAKTRMQRLKNGIDRLFKKDIVSMPEFLTHPQVEKITTALWNAFASGELQDGNKSKDFFNAYAEAKGVDPEAVAREWDELVRSRGVGEYKDFHGKITRGHRDYIQFEPGEPINAKGLDKLFAHLKQYPEWDHPVAKGHNPAITGGDSYEENALSKMMMKMRTRFDAIETLKDEDPAKYYDTIKKLASIGEDLLKKVRVDNDDDPMGDIYPDLKGTDHQNHYDGEVYIGMRSRTQERWQDLLDEMVRGNPSTPFGDSVITMFKDRTQNFIRTVMDQYYETKKEAPDFYKMATVSDIVKERFAGIKEFLTKVDEIAQGIGFDSQADAIAKKRDLNKKAKAYDKEHGPTALYTIKGFSFGGDIYISKEAARDILNLGDDLRDRNLYDKIVFAREDTPHSSQYHTLKAVPNSDYFLALEAEEILANPRLKDNWRIDVAKKVQKAWYSRYKTDYNSFINDYSSLNKNPEIKQLFKQRKVVIDKSLGDGRVGMKGFGHEPLGFKPAELEGPHGEPFSLSAAGSWKVNNPELAKKVAADAEKRKNSLDVQIPIAAGVEEHDGWSSSSIADATNWVSLSKYLKIETGVNDQGANLLKKVYNQYDNNHNWRPEPDPDVCCMPRYVAAVKAAKEYIEKNYIVSGGNYFRKDADGNAGDDVSSIYGTDGGYESARNEYELFDRMMQDGIQNYMPQAEVNKLVAILNGDVTTGGTKNMILQALVSNKAGGGEPINIAQAREIVRNRLSNAPRNPELESVFNKFDKLTLQEQLNILEQSNVLERPLSKGEEKDKETYVKGMKKNSKDFKKRYGKDAKAVMYATATKMAKESITEDGVPNNDRVNLLNTLLADHLPASDLQKQFHAYWAIPVPAMLDAFRDARAMGGDDACMRPIIRSFAKQYLSDKEQRQINFNEA